MAVSLAMTWVPCLFTHREVGEHSRRYPVRSSPENTSPDNAATFNLQRAAILQAHRKRQLSRFSSFVHICLVDRSPYRPEKRVGARRDFTGTYVISGRSTAKCP